MTTMEAGKVIEFWENKRIIAAVCLEARGGRLRILTEHNREASLAAGRVINWSDYRVDPGSSRDDIVQKLKLIVERRNKLKEETSVNELWELLQGEGEAFTGEKLAELWFGKETSSDRISAMQRALSDDKIYFKQKGEIYYINPLELVEQNSQKLEKEKEKQRETEEVCQWLRHIWTGKRVPLNPVTNRFVEILKEMAIFGQEAAEYKRGKEILEKAELTPDRAFNVLVKLGVWRADENLIPYKYLISLSFSGEASREVERIHQLTYQNNELNPLTPTLSPQGRGGLGGNPLIPSPPSSGERVRVRGQKGNSYAIPDNDHDRIDLTHEDIVSIDSETTLDIDDALSLEEEAGGWKLGVHIADAAYYIQRGSILDAEAMERATSIYLPENKIPMLPNSLSEDLISLNPGGKKRALSLIVRMSSKAETLDFTFFPSWVEVKRRLSYEDVDSSMGKDHILTNLHDLALKLKQKRLDSGAMNFTTPELEISVDENRKISLMRRERETPSQIMVSECMILANSLAAEFCRTKGIPIIYRSQLKPSDVFPFLAEFDPALLYRLRRLMSRAEITTVPKPHAGLGLESYTNFTSPIRRYADLVVERQIRKCLRGERDLYSEEELRNIIFSLEPALSRASTVQQESKRYWLLKYLEGHKGGLISAIVLDVLFNRLIIWLEPYLLETELSLRGGKEVKSGDRILVRLEAIHARDNFIKLSLV